MKEIFFIHDICEALSNNPDYQGFDFNKDEDNAKIRVSNGEVEFEIIIHKTYASKPQNKQSLFDTNFVISGTKEELLEAEKVLQANGIRDSVCWNECLRANTDFLMIAAYGDCGEELRIYDYLKKDACNLTAYTFKEFMELVQTLNK